MSDSSTASGHFTSSLIIGFLLGLVVVFLAHLLPKNWSFMPISSDNFFSYNDKVSSCGYTCALGAYHFADCSGLTASDVGKQQLGIGELLSATFERHLSTIMIIGFISSILIFILKRSGNSAKAGSLETSKVPTEDSKAAKTIRLNHDRFDDRCHHCGGIGWEYRCATCYTQAVLEPSTEKYDGEMYCPECAKKDRDYYNIKEDLCSVCDGSGKDPDPYHG